MSQASLERVRSIFAAWERGDFSSAEWVHPDIELVVTDGPDQGVWRGLDQMAKAWSEWLGAFEEYRVEADAYRELRGGGVVLVLVRHCGRGKASGLAVEELDREGANVFWLLDGKVVRLALYWSRDRALADLGLTPHAD
jgi:ketosteroid isomerase-like protein